MTTPAEKLAAITKQREAASQEPSSLKCNDAPPSKCPRCIADNEREEAQTAQAADAPALALSVEQLGAALEDCLQELASEAAAAAVAEGRIPRLAQSAVAGHKALATIPPVGMVE